MQAHALRSVYLWGLKIFLFVIPFLSLWIAQSMYFPYITGRNFGFRVLIELGLVLWVGLMILDKSYRPKTTLMFWAVSFLVIILGLADLLGVSPYNSFWSRFERMEGYLMFLHLFGYFLLLISVFKTKKDWLTFFNLFVIAGLFVGGYGIMQALGLREAIQGGGERIDGTIGNPTYLAAYIMLVSVLSLIMFLNAKSKQWRYFYSGTLVFNLIILYFTASRGAFLALMVTLPIFLLAYIFLIAKNDPAKKLYKKIAIAALAVIVLVPFAFQLVKNTNFVRGNNILVRFADLSLTDFTIRARFYIWNIGLQGFLERPILGWGQENFLQVFAKHYDPRLYDQEPWFDRPHNIIFDWLINAGILGLISYLSLFVIFFMNLYQSWKSKVLDTREGVVLLLAPVAYFIQNLFVFDNFNTYIIFFALIGYLDYLGRESDSAQQDRQSQLDQRRVMPSIIAATLLLMIAGGVAYFVNIRPATAAKGIIDGLQATADQTDPVNKTLSAFKSALELKTFGETEVLEQLARISTTLMNQSVDNRIKASFLNFASEKLEDYIDRFPNDIRVRLFTGALYAASASFNPQGLTKANGHFNDALKLSPKKQSILFVLADNYLRLNNAEKALALLNEAVKLEPKNFEAQTNKAIIYLLLGQNAEVLKVIETINQYKLGAEAEISDRTSNAFYNSLERIGSVYMSIGDLRNAKAIFEQLVKLHGSERFKEMLKNINEDLSK